MGVIFYTLSKEETPNDCGYIEAVDFKDDSTSYSSGQEMCNVLHEMKRYRAEVVESIFAEPESAARFMKKYDKLPLTSQLFVSRTTPRDKTSVFLKFAMDEEVQQLVSFLQHGQEQSIEVLKGELQIVRNQFKLNYLTLNQSQRELIEANTEIKQLKEKLNQGTTKPWWKKLFGG
jgi:hypothetical protein